MGVQARMGEFEGKDAVRWEMVAYFENEFRRERQERGRHGGPYMF